MSKKEIRFAALLMSFALFVTLIIFAHPVAQIAFVATFVLIILSFLVLPLVPGFIDMLTNEPNEFRPEPKFTDEMKPTEREQARVNLNPYPASTFAFFTYIAPGQIKAVIRGDRFVRFIMKYSGRTFRGFSPGENEVAPRTNSRKYWDVIKTPQGSEDSHPIPESLKRFPLDPIWYWSRYVYMLTGAVFTGIPPFQTVQVYSLEQLRKVVVGGDGDAFLFVRVKYFSDHVRAADFQFFVVIPGAETNDQVQVRLEYSVTVQVRNPYRVLYDTDLQWASRLLTAIVQEASATVRRLGFEQVIAAKDADTASKRELVRCITRLNDDLSDPATRDASTREADVSLQEIGLYIKGAELLDAEVNDPILAEALADIAKSKADAEALDNRSMAKARAIDREAKAARSNGHEGQRAQELAGQIATVQAAKDGVILNVGISANGEIDSRTALLRKTIEGSN